MPQEWVAQSFSGIEWLMTFFCWKCKVLYLTWSVDHIEENFWIVLQPHWEVIHFFSFAYKDSPHIDPFLNSDTTFNRNRCILGSWVIKEMNLNSILALNLLLMLKNLWVLMWYQILYKHRIRLKMHHKVEMGPDPTRPELTFNLQ